MKLRAAILGLILSAWSRPRSAGLPRCASARPAAASKDGQKAISRGVLVLIVPPIGIMSSESGWHSATEKKGAISRTAEFFESGGAAERTAHRSGGNFNHFSTGAIPAAGYLVSQPPEGRGGTLGANPPNKTRIDFTSPVRQGNRSPDFRSDSIPLWKGRS